MVEHDLTSTVLRAVDRVTDERDGEVWVIERWPNYFSAFSVGLAQSFIDTEQAKLVVKISR